MEIYLDPSFNRAYKKLIRKNPNLHKTIKEKLKVFAQNPHSSSLKVHKLTGLQSEQWSFSIKSNLRIIFVKSGRNVILTDIGSHNQVY